GVAAVAAAADLAVRAGPGRRAVQGSAVALAGRLGLGLGPRSVRLALSRHMPPREGRLSPSSTRKVEPRNLSSVWRLRVDPAQHRRLSRGCQASESDNHARIRCRRATSSALTSGSRWAEL